MLVLFINFKVPIYFSFIDLKCRKIIRQSSFTGFGDQNSVPGRKILKRSAIPTRNLPISHYPDHTKTKHVNRATKFHSPELQIGTPQNCFICNSMGVADEPRFCCGKCQVNLCLKPCFKVNVIFLLCFICFSSKYF